MSIENFILLSLSIPLWAIGFLLVKFIKIDNNQNKIKLKTSQRRILKKVYPAPSLENPKPKKSQANIYNEKKYVKVVFLDTKAYWIADNTFYEADHVAGKIDRQTQKPVDIISMDKVQLDKMIFIVQTLTEGTKDENRNPRN